MLYNVFIMEGMLKIEKNNIYEQEKNLEKTIDFSREIIESRLSELGVKIKNKFPDNFCTTSNLSQFTDACAAYEPNEDIVLLDNDFNLQKINHELLHAYSSKYRYDERDKEDIQDDLYYNFTSTKTGFSTSYFKNDIYEKPTSESFSQINEAITEKLNTELLLENESKIKEEGVFEQVEEFYQDYINILDSAIRGIALETSSTESEYKKQKEDIWKKIQTAYFNGNTMFLRIFNKVYGKDFLKKLNSMNMDNDLFDQDISNLLIEMSSKNMEIAFRKKIYVV